MAVIPTFLVGLETPTPIADCDVDDLTVVDFCTFRLAWEAATFRRNVTSPPAFITGKKMDNMRNPSLA